MHSALALGDEWAHRALCDLRDEHRSARGGWPGTMTEARARTRAHFSSPPLVAELGTLSGEELEIAARATYRRARQVWLSRSEPETETG